MKKEFAVYEVKVDAFDSSISPETGKAEGWLGLPSILNVLAADAEEAVAKAKADELARFNKINDEITAIRLVSVHALVGVDIR